MQKQQNRLSIFTNGIVKENPLLVISIGLCSSLAVTTNVFNGIGMGFSMMFVLVMSELIIAIFRNIIPEDIRLPIFIIVIAAFTTIVQLLLEAYIPALSASLGVFLPLIVVNCIIMGRVESFASKEGPLNAVLDAFGMGFGYTWVLCAISIVRELLGSGSLFGKAIIPEAYTVKFLSDAPGGFFVFGLLSAVTLAAERAAKIRKAKAKAKGGAA
ncbi:electron transport complex subunit RsxE [Treponema sp. Marseille-Q4132]|uniref:electron transport complex subunit RsxE n=1 Tax=Treponema sp. Marseille-Q4132 TaxID=2766701 RepID=UPI00165312EC|nr:electron transport complex subunit RsxE [Treponema sp. Marseille-Q4132]QNL98269.1 electron transport complex subunit RsxE [Treponema sp. Marseille-Q4132]